ncbi:MAG: M24 family metallopeptidase, partial [Longicatena sp.]
DITDKAFLHICDFIKVGQTEFDIAIELEYTMKKLGATGLAFDSIIVSGVNSSLPHGVPSDKKIEQGDFITMDFGASYNGYCSDMTRTVAIGKISDEQQKVYDTVLKAQLMAIDAIKAGVTYSDIDNVARSYIYSQGYEGCFGHGLGHSLGLYIHEDPRFSYACHEVAQENVMMTVEPGVYLSGKFGVRIEDMVLITENGVDIITKSEKKLITL